MKRKETGITLIALVITVIVMIILAGVAINLTIGDNGIFNKTKITAEEHRGGTVEEQRDLWRADREMYQYVEGNGRKSLEELLVELRGKNLLSDEEVEIIKRDKIITIGSHVIDFTITDEIDYSKLPAGLYETGTTTLIKSWEQLKQDGDITVSGTTFTKMLEGLKGDLVISNEITIIGDGNYNSGLIGEACLYDIEGKITKVYIPSSVEKINRDAFANFLELREVIIENGVKEIGGGVFYRCTDIKMEIPASVTTIGSEYQGLDGGFAYIKVNKDNPVYDSRNDCNAVIETATNTLVIGSSNTIIPDTITSIGDRAFYKCTGLKSIEIPASVTAIEGYAFYGCTGLKSIEISASVTAIESYAFYGCTGLKSIEIPASVTTIEGYAFYGCTGLTSVEISENVTSLNYAFGGCTGLTSIEIPASVTSLNYAFVGCAGLSNLKVDKDNPVYDSRDNCNAIIETNTNTLIVGTKSTKIPDTVTSIGDSAFSGCTGLTSIKIPTSITTIGRNAFMSCENLTNLEIQNGVTNISEQAFWGCTSLRSIKIPESVVTLKSSTFGMSTNLTVEIPNTMTSIDSRAFSYSSNITFNIRKPKGSISGSPWGATNATINWDYEGE